MAISELGINCNSEEEILGEVKDAWLNFIDLTTGISSSIPRYSQERERMVRRIKAAVPEDCYDAWTEEPDYNDKYKRSKIDQVIDEALLIMQEKHPEHPAIVELIRTKPYWTDYAKSGR